MTKKFIPFGRSRLPNLRGILEQPLNGSPSKPRRQVHIGLWLVTRQSALAPQRPGQGSLQRCCMHAVVWLHSELTRHSGRQLGGAPIMATSQEQTQTPFCSLCWLYAPQGLGSHGSVSSTTGIPAGTRVHCVIASPV